MMSPQFVKQQLGWIDVAVDGLRRLLGNQSHTDGGRKVIDGVDTMTGLLDTSRFAKIRADDPQLWIRFQVLEVPATSGTEVVDHDDFLTTIEKKFGKVGADEATTSGDQNSHEVDPGLKN